MPQNDYMEQHKKRFGERFDAAERRRKKAARQAHEISKTARKLRGIKAKIFNRKRFVEKAEMKKTIRQQQQKDAKASPSDETPRGAVPSFLLDRQNVLRTKVLSNLIKQKRKEKAGKWQLPIPKVKALNEEEMFRVLKTGKRKRKMWKRMVNKVCFVGEDFTRKPPKYERYIRPTGLRFKTANVTHPDLKATFQLQIVGVKRNPQSNLYTNLGVITKGTVIEVNVSELGLVTQTGKLSTHKSRTTPN